MQQLETYFGCRVTLGKSITAESYKTYLRDIAAAFDKSGIKKDGVELYICQVRIDPLQSHFDPSPLSEKLNAMHIRLAINRKHHDAEKMYFLNDRIAHTIAETLQREATKFELAYQIPGTYFATKNSFQEIIYVVIDNSVKPRDRRIKVKCLATPTSKFAGKLRNRSSAHTKLDLDLDPLIQLRFDI